MGIFKCILMVFFWIEIEILVLIHNFLGKKSAAQMDFRKTSIFTLNSSHIRNFHQFLQVKELFLIYLYCVVLKEINKRKEKKFDDIL